MDNSKQTYAEVEITIDGRTNTYTIKGPDGDTEEEPASVYSINTSTYTEGAQILWRVRTSGITNTYGPWSVQRTVNIYSQPSVELSVLNANDEVIDVVETFPFKIRALARPNTQAPTGYHLTISANDSYETTDNMGDVKIVSKNEVIYSQHFDEDTNPLVIAMSANDVNLENNQRYTITCVASMNSGLNAEQTAPFEISWVDPEYEPNAEIGVDEDALTAQIRPYCEERIITRYRVIRSNSIYTLSAEAIGSVFGTPLENVLTTTGEQVYSGTTDEGESVFYCIVETASLIDGVTLSVYRREFDGKFTEIATGINNMNGTFVMDPHPALDYARYRIVARDEATGAISYKDVPGHPIGETAAIIQWDESWKTFDVSNEDSMSEPSWTGQVLKLHYNIDVSNNHKSDVELVEYIGREHPVSYYGTQLGETATWNVVIRKDDSDTLFTLRRLAIWQGDVYVREPSGSGYWANVTVGYGQKHNDLTIPITLNITRVEGGM